MRYTCRRQSPNDDFSYLSKNSKYKCNCIKDGSKVNGLMAASDLNKKNLQLRDAHAHVYMSVYKSWL